jgi:hypothetical protein
MDAFRTGLADDIKDVLASSLDDIPDLETLVAKSIKIDTRLFDRRMEKDSRSRSNQISAITHESSSVSNHASYGDNLNAIQLVNGKVSKSERQRRLKLNLCFYCGGSGHVLKECSKKTAGKPSAAVIAGNPAGSQQ